MKVHSLFRVNLFTSIFLIYSLLCHYSVVSSLGFGCRVTVVAHVIDRWPHQLGRVQEGDSCCCWRTCVVWPLPPSFHSSAPATGSCFRFFKWVMFFPFLGALSVLLPLLRIFFPGFSKTWFHLISVRKP